MPMVWLERVVVVLVLLASVVAFGRVLWRERLGHAWPTRGEIRIVNPGGFLSGAWEVLSQSVVLRNRPWVGLFHLPLFFGLVAFLAKSVLHVLLGLPLNALLPRATAAPVATASDAALAKTRPEVPAAVGTPAAANGPAAAKAAPEPPRHTAALLSLVFALAWFVNTAMAAHLPTVIQAAGGTLALAVVVGALVGPAQVAGRLFEFGFLRRVSPLAVARAATLGHPLGALLLWTLGAPAAAGFAVLHGLGNGIMTIAKGTLPLAFFGAGGYGARQGWIALPGRALQGLSPWLFGVALERWGAGALWLSAGLALAACAALLCLRLPRPQ